ncbi:hypothetical protein [Swingsia samuiensis]|uniref:DUF2628 domain-containing protein n=1 Tax=Swingsia samuiensis TaxID=1293412 RepID=A0A4Y6UNA6_9PROT|nr:hypothetical protein [Swingsia samuiensis]QDH17861.1 hypothetical protein E3D00_09970 [Swingsia samuiensis]
MSSYVPCIDPRKQKLPILVKEGFSWRVLLLGWVGLLTYGNYLSALLAGAGTFLIHSYIEGTSEGLTIIALHVILAVYTSEIRLWEMRIRGREIGPPIWATSKDTALMSWINYYSSSVKVSEPSCASS